jgi:hypothetical protein
MLMRCAKLRFVWAALLLVLFAGCGGGNSSETTCSGGALAAALCSSGGAPTTVALTSPATGANTTEVIVDSGPAGGFSLERPANVPFVTVTICPPNSGAASSTGCVTVDHVFLDTGSYGLRLLKSKLSSLFLPSVTLPANTQFGTSAGTALECYPFVLGGIWGPLATADVHIGGETAASIPIQLIDDPSGATLAQQDDCIAAAGGKPYFDDCITAGDSPVACRAKAASKYLYSTAAGLQANGILGVGMMPYDCGSSCTSPLNYAGFFVQYYVCPDSVAANCQAAAVDTAQQVQNPVVHFVPDDGNPQNNGQPDNNGTLISLPDPSPIGAGVAKGSLVFGIGSRSNNQIDPRAKRIMADARPWLATTTSGSTTTTTAVSTCTATATTTCTSNPGYLYFNTVVGSSSYPDSYIDSGSNAYFFIDSSIAHTCTSSTWSATTGGWYCPPGSTAVTRSAILSDWSSNTATADFSIANSDLLFGTSSTAFNNLGGSFGNSAPGAAQAFVWGLPFFYGRSVYTSIWGQSLSSNGPWNAFYVF